MSSWTIYWITRLDSLHGVLVGLLVLSAIVMGVAFFVSIENEEWKPITFAVILLAFVVSAKALTPTTKEMCAIIAIPAIVNNADTQEIGSEVIDLAKDWLKELHPTKETK